MCRYVTGVFYSSGYPDQLTIAETSWLTEPNLYPVIRDACWPAAKECPSGLPGVRMQMS